MMSQGELNEAACTISMAVGFSNSEEGNQIFILGLY